MMALQGSSGMTLWIRLSLELAALALAVWVETWNLMRPLSFISRLMSSFCSRLCSSSSSIMASNWALGRLIKSTSSFNSCPASIRALACFTSGLGGIAGRIWSSQNCFLRAPEMDGSLLLAASSLSLLLGSELANFSMALFCWLASLWLILCLKMIRLSTSVLRLLSKSISSAVFSLFKGTPIMLLVDALVRFFRFLPSSFTWSAAALCLSSMMLGAWS
mmetsp:Transcript_10281/g.18586  ORF Transcript_10281/g.18586 Transcript_10281/m.18586 type:complete len:219 (+) Transcript_10281:69-725(+)